MISRILVPVDFSERSLRILRHAKLVASRYGGEVTLLHVVNPVYTVPAMGPFGALIVPAPASVVTDSGKRLEEFGRDELEGVRVRRVVYEGDAAEQIVEFARSENTDLIVMSTHGHGRLREFLIGSVSAKALHDVECPVLTGVHMAESGEAKAATISNVLCAVELGPQSERTLRWAAEVARDFHAPLGIVHAGASGAPEKVEKLLGAVGVKAAAVCIEDGDVTRTVIGCATSTGADLLVIGRGAHKEGHSIIRQSPCPVVSV